MTDPNSFASLPYGPPSSAPRRHNAPAHPYPAPAPSSQTTQHDTWSADESADHDDKDDDDDDDSKKRKRPMSVSCELCKQRKVRCDRGQPSCGWCLRNGQLCEYKERKKPGLRAGYGRELEARLDRLESVIHSQQSAINHLLQNAHTPSHSASVPSPSAQPSEANMFMSSAIPPNSSALSVSQQQHSSPYTPNTPASTFQSYGSAYQQSQDSYAKHDPALLQQDASPYYQNGAPSQQPQQQQQHPQPQPQHQHNPSTDSHAAAAAAASSSSTVTTQDHDLPPYDLLYSLVNLYFKHVNTWCPILHRRSTFDTLFGPSSLDVADRILLHAIVATTLRFSTDVRLNPDTKEKYHTVSKQKVLLYGLENSSVKALQALVILALDLVGVSNGPPGWNALALISRSAVQLGLSTETTSPSVAPRVASIYTLRATVLPEPANWIEDESRRRLFWMIYILDRYATLTTAFEFALDEREIDRKLPCRDDLFNKNQPVETRWFRGDERPEKGVDKPENLGSFSYYVEVVAILSRIHVFLKQPVDISAAADVEKWQTEYRRLDAALNAWKESLPKEYSNSDRLFDSSSANNNSTNCGWVMLHATYHTTVMRLHSSAAYPARRSHLFSPSFQASKNCLTAVESISALCAHVKNNAMLSRLGPPFAFSVWVASRLLVVHSSTIDHQINPAVQFLVSTLRDLGAYWNVADRYAKLLQRVLDEFADSEMQAASSQGGGRSSTPSSVKILADMRRNAFDLDILISRQGRHARSSDVGIGNNTISAVIATDPTMVANSAVTRAPQPPNEQDLDYLDVFDFFNMPRLPLGVEPTSSVNLAMSDNGMMVQGDAMAAADPPGVNEFNFTNTAWDASDDWFMKSPAGQSL